MVINTTKLLFLDSITAYAGVICLIGNWFQIALGKKSPEVVAKEADAGKGILNFYVAFLLVFLVNAIFQVIATFLSAISAGGAALAFPGAIGNGAGSYYGNCCSNRSNYFYGNMGGINPYYSKNTWRARNLFTVARNNIND